MKTNIILIIVGVIMTLSGIFLIFSWDMIFNYLVSEELPLSPTSRTFQEWRDPTTPLLLDFYFFNWTNPEELYEENYKPNLVEVGPYSFNEFYGKMNVTWNKNNTISYRRRRFWYFNPDKSNGTLDDIIVTLDPIPLSAAYVLRSSNSAMKMTLGMTASFTRQKVSVSRTAGEFLYSGYSNELLTLATKMPKIASTNLPGDRFAWFYKRNGSEEAEGVFNMETGAEDISKIGKLREWNYKNRTDFYRAECGMINGSDGAFYSPGQTRNKPIEMFSAEICKTIKLDYAEDADIDGVLGYRYVGSKMLLDSGELDPNNWCNCNGECVPQGVFNISACRYGAPAFVSYPHFLYADPSYLRQVAGVQPNETKHRFHITVEPKTGIPIDVAARFQINLLLQPFDYISIYKKVPRIFFPMIWFEETFKLSPDRSEDLKQLLSLPEKGFYLSCGIIILGLLMICVAVFRVLIRKSEGKYKIGGKNYELTEPVILRNSPEENILVDSKDPEKKVAYEPLLK